MMNSYTDIIIDEIFESESEEQFLSVIQTKQFINSGSGLQQVLSSCGLTKKQFIDLLYNSPFNDTPADSVRKKVDNWLNGRNQIDRFTAFTICILLGLTIDMSRDFFVKVLGEKWIHHRNCGDIIFDFCIRNGYDIFTAKELVDEFCVGIEKKSNLSTPPTKYLKHEYETAVLDSEQHERIYKMREFLYRNMSSFGFTRKTLYNNFMKILSRPNVFCGDDLIKANGSIDTAKLANMLLDTEDVAEQAYIKAQKSLRVRLDRYISGDAEVPRNIFIKCLLICGVSDIDTLNNILFECGLNELYSLNRNDVWFFDALINSEEGMAYSRLIETFGAYHNTV